jgi:PAS domain S-box-containing protein
MIEQIISTTSYQPSPAAVPLLATAVVCFIISSAGALREGRALGRALFVLGGTVVIWFISAFFLKCSINEQVALWWARAIYIGVPLMPAALYHFTVHFLRSYPRYKRCVWAGWLLSALLVALFVGTDLLINGVRHYTWGYRARFTLLSTAYLAFFLGFLAMSVLLYYRDYQTAEPGSIRRKRTRLLLIAFGISSGGFVDYLSDLSIPVYPFGFLPVLISIVLMAFTIWRYRLVDITPQFAAQNVLDTMNDALFVLDADSVIRLINKAAVQLFGYAEQDFLGRHITAIIDDKALAGRIAVPEGNEPILHQELINRQPGGGERILDLSISAMKGEDHQSLAHVLIIRDITNIKQAEKELVKARDELELRVEERSSALKRAYEQLAQEKNLSETIIDSLPGIFYICDEEGRLIRWNSNEKEVTGYSQQELSQMDVYQLFWTDRNLMANKMQEVIKTGQTVMEISLITKSGLPVPFYLTGYRMLIGDKPYIIGVGINISERKKLEEQFRQAQKMEAIGLLAGGVAHDFNNILSAIVGYSHITLIKMDENDPLRHNIEQILESSERAAVLTQSLLAFSRKQVVNLAVINLNEVIKAFEKFLHRLIREDITLKINCSEGPLWIMADRAQMEQMVMNLVTNARDAMPNGGKLVIDTRPVNLKRDFIEEHGYGKEGEYAFVAVSDTGIGMDEKTITRVFEPFFTTKEQGKGTGLGLSMVYGIVKQHEGFINITSEQGTGTTFKIYFPLTREPADADRKKKEMLTPPRGGAETILVAEDDEALRQMSVVALSHFGYTVIEAVDGADAVTKFKENRENINLVILDGIMPRMNGREASRQIKAMSAEVKCIFMSGYAEDIFTKDGVPDRETALILKPFSPADLLKKIREVLDR